MIGGAIARRRPTLWRRGDIAAPAQQRRLDACPNGRRKNRRDVGRENGATEKQLMAMFGWSSSAEASLYTRAADQARLAAEGSRLATGQFQKGDIAPPATNTLENK
jgi:hypothetical protein